MTFFTALSNLQPDQSHLVRNEMTTSIDDKFNPEVIVITDHKVSCDGGGGALGHPVVWYDLVEDDKVECKYCDRIFVRKGSKYDTSSG